MAVPSHQNGVSNGAPNGAPNGVERKKKQLILNAFVMNTPAHLSPGLWRHPRNDTANYKKLKFWTDLAQLLDKGKFHASEYAPAMNTMFCSFLSDIIQSAIQGVSKQR